MISENNLNDAPLPEHKNTNNNFLICPECFSALEIISIDEDTNMFEFNCTKNKHKNNKVSIIQYLNSIKNIMKINNLSEFKDKCEVHKNNNNFFISYCFDCKCHICNECLESGTHISHKKNNIIEIKPIEQELKVISEFIKEYKIELAKLYNEKKMKTKELNDELENKIKQENKLLKNKIRRYGFENKIEIEQSADNYISDINEIKKKYEEEIKKLKQKYENLNKSINNKYKLKNEKEKIKYNLKIEKLNMIYKNKIDSFKFEEKIERVECIKKLNENVFNAYQSYNNNYFNALNINNILVIYLKNKSRNEKIKALFENEYDKIVSMIMNKYNEGINLIKKLKELNGVEDLKNQIKQETIKSKELSEINVQLSEKNEENEKENNKLIEQIKQVNNKLNIAEEENKKHAKEKEELNNIIWRKNEETRELSKINIELDEQIKQVRDKLIIVEKEKEEENNKHAKEKEELNNIIEEKDEKIRELNRIKGKKEENLIKYEKYFKEEYQEIENYKKQNSIPNFDESPYDLVYKEEIVNNRRNSGLLKNIAVYVKDDIGYLVYQEMDCDLIVCRVYDKSKIATLKGHNSGIGVIRYYKKNDKELYGEEYILSSDCSKLIIVWDINDDFNKKYTIKENFKEYTYDVLILFNIFKKDYIISSSDNQHNYNEYTKLYEFKDNIPFIKNVYNTNKNKNAYLIPWLYKNKYYLISCCDYEISINNIFEDENYAVLIEKPEGGHYCGFLYNDFFLCVSDVNHNFIRIWDLINKAVYKTIHFDGKFGYEMVQWNDQYTIIGCNQCLTIIDLEEGEEVKQIRGKNGTIFGLKKMKDKELGECLICSEDNNTINIYNTNHESDSSEKEYINDKRDENDYQKKSNDSDNKDKEEIDEDIDDFADF